MSGRVQGPHHLLELADLAARLPAFSSGSPQPFTSRTLNPRGLSRKVLVAAGEDVTAPKERSWSWKWALARYCWRAPG